MRSGQQGSSLLATAAGAVLFLLLVASFGLDCGLVERGGSIDYRNRITGARLMQASEDPFFYKWRSGAPEEYCDPYNNLAVKVSQTTVTPTMLLLMLPVAALPYGAAQVVWLLVEWLLLLGTGVIWWLLLPKGWQRWVWAAALTGFSFTLAWRHHIDRGQVYILLGFLISLWVALTKTKHSILAGVVAGLLVCLRPPVLVLLAPFIAFRDRSQWLAAVASLGLFTLLPMAFRGEIWPDYLRGMKEWSATYRQGERPPPPGQAYPATVEGLPLDTLARYVVKHYADSSIIRILKGQGITDFPEWPLGLALLAGAGAWFWCRRRADVWELLAGIVAWVFLSDWFLPAYRNPYNDVLALGVLAAALLTNRKIFWVALLGLPAGWALEQIVPSARWQIHIPTVLLLLGGIGLLLPKIRAGKDAPA